MTTDEAKHIIKALVKKGIHCIEGLSDKEIEQAQKKYNFIFPPDLRMLLQTSLPISERFMNWRKDIYSKEEETAITRMFSWPLEGMIFDIKNNSFWLKSWGEKPNDLNAQIAIAKSNFQKFPKLIPIYSHRYIPETPFEEGNPIFSVYQMDIIYYGYDLASYFANEFKFTLPSSVRVTEHPKKILFWTDWIENEDELAENPS